MKHTKDKQGAGLHFPVNSSFLCVDSLKKFKFPQNSFVQQDKLNKSNKGGQ
jgi:hypothetical protein